MLQANQKTSKLSTGKKTRLPETPVREEELDRLDSFRDVRDRHLVINGLRIAWRPKATLDLLGVDVEGLRRLYVFMALGRAFEERIAELYRQGLVPGSAFFGRGNEGLSVGAASALNAEDTLVPMHRNLPAHLVRGQDLRELMAHYLGRVNGINRGRDLHYGSRKHNIIQLISHIGTMIPIACGAAWTAKYRSDGSATLVVCGDGATSTGDFHQGLNLAAVHHLPLVVVIENNLWAYKTPTRMQYTCKTLALRAIGYGIPGYLIDGTDVAACYEVCCEALERARVGEGPILIESMNARIGGHSIYDAYTDYLTESEIAQWESRDPIPLFEERLRAAGHGDDSFFQETKAHNLKLIEEAVNYAKDSPSPEGHEVSEGVFAP